MVVDVLRHYEGERESDDKLIAKSMKNRCKIEEKSVKIEVWRGRKSKEIGVWRCLGGSWRVLGLLGGAVARFGKIVVETLRRRWAMLGLCLGGFWLKFVSIFEHFGRCAGYAFECVWWFWSGCMGLLRHLRGCFGRCWLQDCVV